MARIKREKEASEAMKLALHDALASKPDNDEARKQRVLRQIDDYLDDMKGASLKTRLMIGKAVAELWKLVQPTAGVSKPSRQRSQAISQPISTPQEQSGQQST